MKHRPLSSALYKKIVEVMPIPCVDVVLVYKKKFLMGKRLNKPAQGQWWLLGGRVLKMEHQEQTAIRKAFQEAHIKVRVKKFLMARDTMFKNSQFGVPTHTTNTVFLVEPIGLKGAHPDFQHSRLQWFSKINPKWHWYPKQALRLAGFK